MGIRDWRLSFKKVEGAETIVPTQDNNRPLSSLRRAFALAEVANETANICRSIVSSALAEPPMAVFDEDGPDYDNSLTQRLADPIPGSNAWLTQTDLWRFVGDQLLGASDVGCFHLLYPNAMGGIATIIPKTGDEVRPVKSTTDIIAGWEYRINSGWYRLDERVKVVWYRTPDSNDLWKHHSPMHDIERALRTDADASEWLDYLLDNMGMLSSLVGFEGIDQKTADSVTAFLNDNLMGKHNAGKSYAVGGKPSTVQLGVSPAEMDFGSLKDRTELAICAAFGVPAELAQLKIVAAKGEGLSGTAYREKRRVLMFATVGPLWSSIQERFGMIAAPMYGLDVRSTRFDISKVSALHDTPLERAKYAAEILRIGSMNEARKASGALEPSTQEGADDIGALTLRTRLTAVTAPAKSSGPFESKAFDMPLWDAKATGYEAEFLATAEGVFTDERTRAAVALEPLTKAAMGDASVKQLIAKAISAVLPGDWEDQFTEKISVVVNDGGDAIAAELGITFDMAQESALSLVEERTVDLAGNVTQTTRDKITAFVKAGLEGDKTVAEIARDITSTDLGPWGLQTIRNRADSIARTETIGALNAGGFEGAGQAEAIAQDAGGAVWKAWLDAGDGNVRPSHQAAAAEEWIPIDQPFGNGLMYPHQAGASADEVVRCRCTAMYETRYEEQADA